MENSKDILNISIPWTELDQTKNDANLMKYLDEKLEKEKFFKNIEDITENEAKIISIPSKYQAQLLYDEWLQKFESSIEKYNKENIGKKLQRIIIPEHLFPYDFQKWIETHPNSELLLKNGIKNIGIGYLDGCYGKSICFQFENKLGKWEHFSYKNCGKSISSKHRKNLNQTLKFLVKKERKKLKNEEDEFSGHYLKEFTVLKEEFFEKMNINEEDVELIDVKKSYTKFLKDKNLQKEWINFHKENATATTIAKKIDENEDRKQIEKEIKNKIEKETENVKD